MTGLEPGVEHPEGSAEARKVSFWAFAVQSLGHLLIHRHGDAVIEKLGIMELCTGNPTREQVKERLSVATTGALLVRLFGTIPY